MILFLFFVWGFHTLTIAGHQEQKGPFPPCYELSNAKHHSFRANCHGIFRSQTGEKILYRFNEDALRGPPRKEMRRNPKRLLLLGDSDVEGWWITEEQTYSSVFSQRYKPWYFINAGLRSMGTYTQVPRLEELLPLYKPEQVWWFLNGTDLYDDRLYCATARSFSTEGIRQDFSLEEFHVEKPLSVLYQWFPQASWMRKIFRYRHRQKSDALVESTKADRCEPCLGLRLVSERLKKQKIPLKIFHAKIRAGFAGRGVKYESEQVYADCAEKLGLEYVATDVVAKTPEEERRFHYDDDPHLTAAGTVEKIRQLEAAKPEWFQELKKPLRP